MLPNKPLYDFVLDDVRQLITDRVPESDRIEYKQGLPAKDQMGDAWVRGEDKLGQYAKEKLLAEVIALANSHGGYLLLGVEETDDKPPRALALKPLPRCVELAERIMQIADDCIDPKLPHLETKPLPVASDGSGIIIFHTLRSTIAPHRLNLDKECYIRRNERCLALSMREIQDLTLHTHRQAEEGLWTASFGYPVADRNGGVVVLEAGRLFGGDSSHYYEGRYEEFEEKVRAEFRVVHYFGDPLTAFGDRSPRFTVLMEGVRQGERITGTLFRYDIPQVRPQIILQRRANLP